MGRNAECLGFLKFLVLLGTYLFMGGSLAPTSFSLTSKIYSEREFSMGCLFLFSFSLEKQPLGKRKLNFLLLWLEAAEGTNLGHLGWFFSLGHFQRVFFEGSFLLPTHLENLLCAFTQDRSLCSVDDRLEMGEYYSSLSSPIKTDIGPKVLNFSFTPEKIISKIILP